MAQRSSIDRLPPDIRVQVDQAIHAGDTIDNILGLLLDLQEKGALEKAPRRSAVGRYSLKYRELAAQQRDMSSVAKAFGAEFGNADDMQGRLMIQLVTSLITRVAMDAAGKDELDLKSKEIADLARAVKDATSAAKTDVDRDARIREEAVKQARRQAADEAVSAAKATGASEETINRVRSKILGIAA